MAYWCGNCVSKNCPQKPSVNSYQYLSRLRYVKYFLVNSMVYRMRICWHARYTIVVFTYSVVYRMCPFRQARYITHASTIPMVYRICHFWQLRCFLHVLNSMVYRDTPSMSRATAKQRALIPAGDDHSWLAPLIPASSIRQLLLYWVILPRPVPYKEAFRYGCPCRKLAALLLKIVTIHLGREVLAPSFDIKHGCRLWRIQQHM